MPLPQDYMGLVHDVKRLFKRNPVLSSTVLSVTALVAIAYLTSPIIQRYGADEDGSPSSPQISAADANNEISGDRSSAEDFSEDDIRIGADIDNVDALLRELEQNEGNTESISRDENFSRDENSEQPRRPLALLDPARLAGDSESRGSLAQEQEGRSPILYDNLFNSSVPQENVDLAASIPSLFSPNLFPSSTSSPESPLGNAGAFGNASVSPTQEISERSLVTGQIQPTDSRIGNDSSLQPASSLNPVPLQESTEMEQFQTSPSPGTTGYTVPQAFQAPINPYTQQVNPQFYQSYPSASGQPVSPSLPNALTTSQPMVLPGLSNSPSGISPGFNNFNNSFVTPTPIVPTVQPTFSVSPNSFSVPTRDFAQPRRYNGGGRGGEINTFSNP